MAKVYPIIFSYFSKSPKKVERDYKEFFFSITAQLGIKTTIDEIFMGEFRVPALLDLPQEATIEQVDSHLKIYSESLADTVQKKFIKNEVIEQLSTGEFKFKDDSPHVIIYFQASFAVPPKSLSNLYQLLRKLLSNSLPNSLQKKVIIVLPTVLPSKKEFVFSENIQEECEANQVIIYDQNGRSINPAFNQESTFEQHKIQNRDQTLRLMEAKLIGRIGHFQREHKEGNKVTKSCHLYFYDGTRCIDEVTSLLTQKIDNTYSTIVYHCPESPWLESAIQNLTIVSGLTIDKYNILVPDSIAPLVNSEKGTKVLFVVDLIHTGKTLTDQIDILLAVNPNLIIDCCSVLYSGDLPTIDNKAVKIGTHTVSYFLKVRQQTFQQGGCEMCKTYHIQFYDPNKPDPFIRLQSYFYWKLSDLYGYLHNSEEDPPTYRSQLPIVPKFKDLLVDCGAYIASKIISYFDATPDLNPAHSYIFICPAEQGSVLIGRSLENLKEISVIAVPKEILQLINEKRFNKDEIKRKYKDHEWLRALLHFEEESANKSVVVFDEFTYTGKKLEQMALLAKEFKLDVACYFPFVLYNQNIEMEGRENVHSLYSFNLNLSKPAV